jgi:hypothetical protein
MSHSKLQYTGEKMDLHVRLCNAEVFRKSVVNMGINLYNKLPYQIKTGHDKIFLQN